MEFEMTITKEVLNLSAFGTTCYGCEKNHFSLDLDYLVGIA